MLNYMNFIPRDPWFIALLLFLGIIAVYHILVWALKYRVTKRVTDHIAYLEGFKKDHNDS